MKTSISLLLLLVFSYREVNCEGLTLNVLHINDIHSYFEETNHYSGRCRETSDQCIGGVARVYTKQKEIRDKNPTNTIFLNAGDFYQGTVWYSKFKYAPMIEFGNRLNYTAMGLGNHDFDDHVAGITPFADQVSFDLLASNLVTNTDQFVEGVHFKRSVVKEIDGTKVGIIGYITQMTEYNFPDNLVTFGDEIESVSAEAQKLHDQGVNVLIALGHSGYEIDMELARQIPLLDVVVGGHSHTFLYTPKDEDDVAEDRIEGPYPTYITSASGKVIPVVQAKCYTKYLGHLILNFDEAGELLAPVEAAGVSFAQPYLLDDQEAKQDPETLEMMVKYKNNLTEYKTVYGYTEVVLVESISDSEEDNIGNALTDSMASVYDDTEIALVNNGGIRSSFPQGDITGEDIFMVLPFENTVDKLRLKGRELKKALELACNKLDPHDPDKYPGFGLQVAGLQLKIRPEEGNEGSRIISFKVKNKDGYFVDLDMDVVYSVAVGSFLAPTGKQAYLRGIFDNVEIEEHITGEITDYEAFKSWLILNTPINPQIEGRLEFQFQKKKSEQRDLARSSSARFTSSFSAILFCILKMLF